VEQLDRFLGPGELVRPARRRPRPAGQPRGAALIALRRAHPELGPGGSLEILHDAYPLAYLRDGRFLVIINPSARTQALPHHRPYLATATPAKQSGVTVTRTAITTAPFSDGIFRL
jgi:alpha-glucosidase